ncbi:hypothetical protein CRYUN_Cryun03dG0105600 [Craigia yunnanensis]
MGLKIFVVVVVVGLIAAAQISLASTVPAFLWSPISSSIELKESVNYQIMSPKDLANSVLSQGGWSDLLCSGRKREHPVDLAIVFVGRELHSSHVAGNKHVDPALLNLLKVTSIHLIAIFFFFIRSHLSGPSFSMAFPYVAPSEEETMENLLVSGEIMNEVISSVEQSRAKYAALYVSNPFKSFQQPGYREFERFLAEHTAGNASANSTGCDEVCKIKSSLLEGVLVGKMVECDPYSQPYVAETAEFAVVVTLYGF